MANSSADTATPSTVATPSGVDEQAAIRPHIKLFVDGVLARNLSLPIAATAELMIVGALSGG